MKNLFLVFFIFSNLSLFCQSFAQFDSPYEQISFNINPNECSLVLKNLQDSSLLNGVPFSLERLSNSTFVVYAPLDSAANLFGNSALLYPSLLDANNQTYYITNEIILKFKNNVSAANIAELEVSFNLTETETSNYFKVYQCDDPITISQAIYNTGLVKYCEPNFFFQLQLASHIPNDPYFDHQFYLSNTGQALNDGLIGEPLQDIKATEAWALTTGHKGIKIAIVDQGGIEIGHPDLPEYKIERNPMFLNTLPYLPGTQLSTTAHGQACAGIIGAEMDNNEGITGICPRGTLVPLGMGTNMFVTKSSDFAMIFYWITDPNASDRPKIMSCSFIAPTGSPYEDAVASGIESGVLFCFAAGNTAQHSNGCDGATSYSGVHEFSNVLIVAASTAQGNAADYSGFGTWVDIAAPSASDVACLESVCGNFPPLPQELPNIWTTDIMGPLGFNSNSSGAQNACLPPGTEQVPTDNNNYTGRFYGTSAATPQVAAVAALMKSANSCISITEIIDILKNTADQIGVDISGIPYNYNHDPLRPGHSVELGYGRLDAFEAVSEALALGGFDFEIEILNYICEEDDNGAISVHFPNGNANDYELFLEWPVYVGFEELPSVQINAEQPVTIPNHGARPYLLRVVHASTGCSSTRQYWMDIENTLEISTSANLDCYPAQICAEVEGGQGPYTYFWNDQLGEACIDLDQNTTLTLNIVDQEGCSISSDLAVEVPAFFEIMDGISTSSECLFIPHSPIQFSNPIAIEGALLEWNFGDGATATGQNVEHTYSTEGEFDVTLSITLPDCEPTLVEETVIIDNFDHPSTVTISNQSEANALLLNNTTFGGDIIFLANSMAYTLDDLTFYLSPSSDIIVNEGASVRINRCTLTSCSIWNGIDVRANSSNDVSEGRIVFDSSMGFGVSTLEYARIAIETRDSRPNADNMATFMLRVGFINCNRTIFRNNLSSLLISNGRPTSPPSAVGFNLCTFTVNDELQDHFIDDLDDYNQFRSHVRMIRIRDYNFRGCVFSNEMTSNTSVGNWRNRGVGISSSGSRFSIQEHQTVNLSNLTEGRFEGLDYGIVTVKTSSTIRISRQNFQRNHIGIFLNHASICRVFKNTFHIGQSMGQSQLDQQLTYGTFPGNSFGIEGDNSLSYEGLVIQKGDFHEIAENNFIGYPNANGGVNDEYARIGVRIRSTNTNEMVVRKNSFSQLSFANLANGDNAGVDNITGLRYICNTNSQNIQDFTNTDFLGTENSARIGNIQNEPGGSVTTQPEDVPWPTGNTFSTDNPSVDTHFRNEGISIQSYWHSTATNQTPTDYDGVIGLNPIGINHSCISQYGTSHVIPSHLQIAARIAEGNVARLEAEEYRYLYLLLVDDGDTEELQNFIENTWGSEVWNTRDQLLAISPFVSMEAVYSLLNQPIIYPHAMTFEILAANPELLRDPKLIDYLAQKNDPMPEYMIDLLNIYSQQSSEKSEIEKTMGEKRIKQISNTSEALWGMMDYDDYTYDPEDFRNVLAEMKVLNSEFFVINDLLDEGDISDAITRLVNIPQLIQLRAEDRREYIHFSEWVYWRRNLILAGRNLESLAQSDLQSLAPIAEAFDTFAASMAISILNEEKESLIFTPPALGKSTDQYKSRRAFPALSMPLGASIHVFPNPTNYLVQVELQQEEPVKSNFTLSVIDVMGKIVYSMKDADGLNRWLLDSSQWSTGVYTIRVTSSTGIELTKTLYVTH
ncbi:MAG: S8 family serine peptidase [Flavobacteriales bacterium]|jgi:subtilisin family serine protease